MEFSDEEIIAALEEDLEFYRAKAEACKGDVKLVSSVSASVHRVSASLASATMHAAHQMDIKTRDITAFRECAAGHAEVLEREAKNIRDAITDHHNTDS